MASTSSASWSVAEMARDKRPRPLEPLAFSISTSSISQQIQSPFFWVPIELRLIIYTYAFTHYIALPFDAGNERRRHHSRYTPKPKPPRPKPDCAIQFLQTCRAVYVEAYQFPFTLNPVLVHNTGAGQGPRHTTPRLPKLAPWQLALVQHLDISLPQIALENGELGNYLGYWNPRTRHTGAFVIPSFWPDKSGISKFTLRPAAVDPGNKPLRDGEFISFEVEKGRLIDNDLYNKHHHAGEGRHGAGSLRLLPFQSVYAWTPYDVVHPPHRAPIYDPPPWVVPLSYSSPKPTIQFRAMVARPLTKLTLRMNRTDWWTWSDEPRSGGDELFSSNSQQTLSLDPALGGPGVNEAICPANMLAYAHQRRQGAWPGRGNNESRRSPSSYEDGWGKVICELPDLKTLELILETWAVKAEQLDTVVECAKLWEFPISRPGDLHEPPEWKLVWDGKVEKVAYTHGDEEEHSADTPDHGSIPPDRPLRHWSDIETDITVRVVRFRRVKA